MEENGNTKKDTVKIILWIAIPALFFICAALVFVGKYLWELKNTVRENETAEVVIEKNLIEEQEEETEQTDYVLLTFVPYNYMALTATPNGDGRDLVAYLPCGTDLKWYGETEEVEDDIYYRVKTFDDLEGFVPADFVVENDFRYNREKLPIVDMGKPLYTYDEMVQDIESLCSQYPEALQYKKIGESVLGQDIYKVILGNPDAKHHIMVQASIHGREYVNTLLVMKMLEYYGYYYDKGKYNDIKYKELFDNTAVHIIPMANPDGVAISQFGEEFVNSHGIRRLTYAAYERDMPTMICQENSNGDMTWIDYYRDTGFSRSSNPNGKRMITYGEYLKQWKSNANGVDLNNNFDADWLNIELKSQPAYSNYKGKNPVSEPESKILVEAAQEKDFECYISYHSTGSLLYYDCVGNDNEMSAMEEAFADIMNRHLKYRKSNLHNAYNANLGGFGDWVQLGLKKASITIESGLKPCPLPHEEFPGIWARHRESWAMLAKEYL